AGGGGRLAGLHGDDPGGDVGQLGGKRRGGATGVVDEGDRRPAFAQLGQPRRDPRSVGSLVDELDGEAAAGVGADRDDRRGGAVLVDLDGEHDRVDELVRGGGVG